MALAEPAYRYEPFNEHGAAPARDPGVRAMRGTGGERQSSTPLLVMAAKMAAVVLVAVAVLAFARIALTSATVSTLIQSDDLSGEISAARAYGVGLEMEQSVLSNTQAIKLAAKRLGMAAPAEVETIVLPPDIVALDADGALSLSGTVENLVGVAG